MLLLTLSTPNVNEHEKRGERTFRLVIHEEIPWYVEKERSELVAESPFCCQFSAAILSTSNVGKMQVGSALSGICF